MVMIQKNGNAESSNGAVMSRTNDGAYKLAEAGIAPKMNRIKAKNAVFLVMKQPPDCHYFNTAARNNLK
jgi:hypothetical protein